MRAGQPAVSNDIATRKIDEAACNGGFLGVGPDYTVAVREDIQSETDGRMLRHGLQDVHERRLTLSRRPAVPDRDALAARWATFVAAGPGTA